MGLQNELFSLQTIQSSLLACDLHHFSLIDKISCTGRKQIDFLDPSPTFFLSFSYGFEVESQKAKGVGCQKKKRLWLLWNVMYQKAYKKIVDLNP